MPASIPHFVLLATLIQMALGIGALISWRVTGVIAIIVNFFHYEGAMFFVLAGVMDRFAYLKPGVALILVLVGIKMTLSYWLHVPTLVSLVGVVGILLAAVLLSLWRSAREARAAA